MKVTLNEAEQRLARFVAAKRNEAAATAGRTNCRRADATDQEINVEGIAAEIALCKLLNCYPDLETAGPLPEYDALARTGVTVDVKATHYPNGRLLALPWKAGKAPDIYALMVGKFPTYRCAGIMRADELLAPERLTDLGHGKTYAAEQAELDDFRKALA